MALAWPRFSTFPVSHSHFSWLWAFRYQAPLNCRNGWWPCLACWHLPIFMAPDIPDRPMGIFQTPVVNMSSGGFHQTSWGYISIAIILLAVVIGSVFIQQSISRLLCSIPEMLEPRLPLPPGSLAHAPVNGFCSDPAAGS